MTKAQILKAAKGLNLDDRMDLVDRLLASVTPQEQHLYKEPISPPKLTMLPDNGRMPALSKGLVAVI